MRRFLLVLLVPLILQGCASKVPVQRQECYEPAVHIVTNKDLAEAVQELQTAIRLCNAFGQEQ